MTRNLKALGLALFAVFAMSAVAASAASATAFKFKNEVGATVVTGSQHAGKDVFTTHAGTVECNEAKYTGSTTGTETTEIEVAPVYSECVAFGFVSVPIDVNGCTYAFNPVTLEGGNYEGQVGIKCPTGKKIEVTAPGCTVKVGAQAGLKKITYTNKGAGANREVTVDVNISGLDYEEVNKGFFPTCVHPGETTTTGTYVGAATVTGETAAKEMKGIWVE